MADYPPGGDAEFGAWLDNFVTSATANMAALGISDEHQGRKGAVERDGVGHGRRVSGCAAELDQ